MFRRPCATKTNYLQPRDFALLHGRFSGLDEGAPNWVVVDIVLMENGVLAEHWDVIQDEATRAQSKSDNSMFGNELPAVAKPN